MANILPDLSALQAKIAELEAKNAELAQKVQDGKRRKPSFKQSENNTAYWTLNNGLMEKGIHPLTTAHVNVWRLIVANVDVIRDAIA